MWILLKTRHYEGNGVFPRSVSKIANPSKKKSVHFFFTNIFLVYFFYAFISISDAFLGKNILVVPATLILRFFGQNTHFTPKKTLFRVFTYPVHMHLMTVKTFFLFKSDPPSFLYDQNHIRNRL